MINTSFNVGWRADRVHAAQSLRSVSFLGARRVVPGTLAASEGRGEGVRRWRVGRGGLRHSFSLAAHARAHGRRLRYCGLIIAATCLLLAAIVWTRLHGAAVAGALARGPGGRGRLLCGTGMAPSDLLYLDASDDPDRLAGFPTACSRRRTTCCSRRSGWCCGWPATTLCGAASIARQRRTGSRERRKTRSSGTSGSSEGDGARLQWCL